MSKYENRMKHFRELKNMTQQELAERLGTSVRNVRRWENGETTINVLDAMAISDVLGAPIEDIFKL